MDIAEVLPKDLNLSLESIPNDVKSTGLPSVAGRDIYSLGSGKGRGGKNIQTPKIKPHPIVEEQIAKNGESSSPSTVMRKGSKTTPKVGSKATPKLVASKLGGGKRKIKLSSVREAVEDESDDESDMEVDDDEEEQEEEPAKKGGRRKSTRIRKVVSSSESDLSTDLSEDDELVALAAKLNQGAKSGRLVMNDEVLEDYFSAHSDKTRMATSDHTLAKLSRPKMDQQSMDDALSTTPSRFQHDRQQLYEEYKQLYPYWLFQISNGFNILLYGVGSKQKLAEDFRKKCLSESCHLVINGFFPGLTIKQVLTKLTSGVFDHSGTFKSPIEQSQFIVKELKTKGKIETEISKGKIKQSTVAPTPMPDEIFLVIHNIDGQMLRGDTAQTALSILAQSPSIHIIASVDHINAPLLWDQKKLSRFNWLWYDTTTYEPYRDETSYENSLLVQQSGSLALSSLIHVADSLTPNARGVFELLVKYQLEYKSEADGIYLGMSFHDCYLKCREKFLVSSDVTLRSQLTEFKDHKLVRSRRGHDGVDYLFIPVDNAVLNQFLEHEQEE
jgi:origin recognition complex subunit 2